MRTLAQLRREADAVEHEAIRIALEDHGWVLAATARALDVRPTELQRLIDRHGLRAEYTRRNPGRGRPKRGLRRCAARITGARPHRQRRCVGI